MPTVAMKFDVPVTVDESKCIKGCHLCVDVCPLDALAINPETARRSWRGTSAGTARRARSIARPTPSP